MVVKMMVSNYLENDGDDDDDDNDMIENGPYSR